MFLHQFLPSLGLAIWFGIPGLWYLSRRDWAEVLGSLTGLVFFACAMHYGGFL